MGASVLVVEGNSDIRSMMVLLIELYGYETIEARDGAEAIRKADEFCPDLILIDLALPDMAGFDATKAIKKLIHCSTTPVIAVSIFPGMRQQAIDAGCVEVLLKPLDFKQLRSALATHLVQ